MAGIRGTAVGQSSIGQAVGTELTRSGYISVCLLILVAIAGCKNGDQPPSIADLARPVKTFVVPAPRADANLRLPGRIRAIPPIDLAFREVSGRIVELPVAGREGQKVLKGELLAQIDSKNFDLSLRSAESSLGEAYSVLELARSENERMEKMKGINPDLVSASMLGRTRERLRQAEARIDSLERKVAQAEKLLEYSSLRAPFTAIVTRCLAANAQEVQAGEIILSLQDVTHLQVLVDAPEPTIQVAWKLGPESISAIVHFPAAPERKFPLTFTETKNTADPTTGTYPLVLEMDKPKKIELPPGTTGTVELTGEGTEVYAGPVLVPAIAVLADPDGKDYVWEVNMMELRVHRRDIRIGRLAESDKIQVVGGLTGGERIVAAGGTQLTEGRQVRLWEEREASEAR